VKCPKCGYIGFEAVDRCRNCGYEFALAVSAPHRDELEMRSGNDPIGPLADLSLRAAPPSRRRAPGGTELDLDRIIGAPESSADLPLFKADTPDMLETAPLISAPAAPRKPLAVRRVTMPPPRARESREQPPVRRDNLELPLPESAARFALAAEQDLATATAAPRVGAALLDTLLLATLDGLVLYFTVRLCSLTMADIGLLPLAPVLMFLLLLNGGYLVAFTAAGGQTIGKMAFGLKVVGPGDSSVPVGTAAVRSLAALASTVCLGAGLLPALFGGRAIHDRLADTRVVHLTR
jgi:uncharacterized RDD family membrane protein YckC